MKSIISLQAHVTMVKLQLKIYVNGWLEAEYTWGKSFQTVAALELGEHLASSVRTDAPRFCTAAVQLCTGWIDKLWI